MKLDLHIHTTASDGAWSPEAVVRGAAKGGLDVIAVADHDTTAAFATASAVGAEVCVQVIPALEVSSTHHSRDVHVLAYFVDLESNAMTAHSARATGRRDERMHEMVDRLTASGIDVTFEQVEAEAGPDRVAIGRPHLARALVAAGHATSVHEAFNTLIGDHSGAFVAMRLLTPVDAVELILEADGIPSGPIRLEIWSNHCCRSSCVPACVAWRCTDRHTSAMTCFAMSVSAEPPGCS